MEKWVISAKRADFKEIGKKFNIDQVTARLIRNRDIIGEDAIHQYLYGDLQHLHSPCLLKDCEKAADILIDKIKEHKKIRVIGDYDIDGVCSTYILDQGLKRCGANVDTDIPDRLKDGYGINEHLISLAREARIDTILTCDNGIAAIDQIAYAKSLGMTVIVTDHHEVLDQIPAADAVVNPKQKDCTYPYKGLCGGAVAFKLICCLYDKLKIPQKEAKGLLAFAAIATVGDVMDLTGENRILVREGLKRIGQTNNYGLNALIKVNGLDPNAISAYHIGFVLGPCINASGRLDTAKKALLLLNSKSEEEAMRLAEELKSLNDERKDLTLKGLGKAVEIIEQSDLIRDKVLVVYLPECHESLAGIIAGRIRERYHKPVFVLTDGEEAVKGSGRSIESYHMFQEMSECQELFLKFGGHPMAAGLSIEKEQIETMRQLLNTQTKLTDEDLIPKVTIDVPMPIDYITEQLIEELAYLEPYGKGNPKPVFAEKNLNILGARILGKNKNVMKFRVHNQSGTMMDALFFGDIEILRHYLAGKFGNTEVEKMLQNRNNNITLSVTYYPSVNDFNHQKTLQIIIQNYQ